MSFLVWRKGLRGPVASLDQMDPRGLVDWKLREAHHITIVPLSEPQSEMSLSTLMALYPCPELVD